MTGLLAYFYIAQPVACCWSGLDLLCCNSRSVPIRITSGRPPESIAPMVLSMALHPLQNFKDVSLAEIDDSALQVWSSISAPSAAISYLKQYS